MNKKQRRWRNRIVVAIAIFAVIMAVDEAGLLASAFGARGSAYAAFVLYLVPYLIAGHDVLAKAARNLARGEAFGALSTEATQLMEELWLEVRS